MNGGSMQPSPASCTSSCTATKSCSPSYGEDVGPRIITLKYLKLSSEGDALIPGAAAEGKAAAAQASY
jgi:hypothetical protein